MSMCVVILVDLLWANVHPKPVELGSAAAAAAFASIGASLHVLLAFGFLASVEYTFSVGMVLQFSATLPWILVQQLGTDFVVATGRSPARFQILAWITVMILGTLVTIYPTLRESPLFVIGVASSPRLIVTMVLLLAALSDVGNSSSNMAKKQRTDDDSYSVALPRAARFALFACNGSVGEALNDMATDLKIRKALSGGDTTLTIAYNIAVMLSMCGGFISESLAGGEGARRIFSGLWGACQFFRSCGMEFLTPDQTWLMFVFVFGDKFTGPLGQAAIDTALLSVMRRGRSKSDGEGWPRMPANALWTLRTAAERLERPLCQLILLRFEAGSAPLWVPITFALIAVSFVQFTLRPGDESSTKSKNA